MHILKAIFLAANLKYCGTLYVQLCILTRQNFLLHRGSEVAPLAETLSIRM